MTEAEESFPAAVLNHSQAKRTEKLLILGASGSVGTTAIRFLEKDGSIQLIGASVHSDVSRLREIASRHRLKFAAISSSDAFDEHRQSLQSEFPDMNLFRGEEGLVKLTQACADTGVDTVLTAVVGACGILATKAAIECGLKIALANKETLVTAGPAIVSLLRRMRAQGNKMPSIIPVDSEHSAVFQLIENQPKQNVHTVILTASGGPFRDTAPENIKHMTREQVLQHPTWNMGPKITVDSAGMINKGLEIIEAHFLFSLPYDRLDVLIHKNSYAHALLRTKDGAYQISVSPPDMVFPIAHALYYPFPLPELHASAASPEAWPPLEFEKINLEKYPGFQVCLDAGRAGGTVPAVLNAANEVAVSLFLKNIIPFTNIPVFLEMVVNRIPKETGDDFALFLEADRKARSACLSIAESVSGNA